MNKAGYIFIIVLGALFIFQEARAQHASGNLPDRALPSVYPQFLHPSFSSGAAETSSILLKTNLPARDHYFSLLSLPEDMSCSKAFFCRQEWKVEKKMKFPIRLRIGSLAQCNALEGK